MAVTYNQADVTYNELLVSYNGTDTRTTPDTPTVEQPRGGGTRYDRQSIDRLSRAARLERARRDDQELLVCL